MDEVAERVCQGGTSKQGAKQGKQTDYYYSLDRCHGLGRNNRTHHVGGIVEAIGKVKEQQ